MAKQLLHIKVDPDTKREAKKLAEALGLPLSALINAHLKEMLRTRRIELTAPHRMSRALEIKLRGVEKDLARGRNLSPAFTSPEAMDAYLDAR